MPHDDQANDIEMDPKKLRFGMSTAERRELEAEVKRKRKKLAKNWRPMEH
jgi:hypothetical protein